MVLRVLVGHLFACACVLNALCAETGTGGSTTPRDPAACLYDTGSPAAIPLTAHAVAGRDGWTEVEPGQKGCEFKGDAVLANDRLAVVLRRASDGLELYSLAGDKATRRAVLIPQ